MAPWRLNQVAGPTGCPVRPLDAAPTIPSWRNARKRPLVRGILIAMDTVPTLESVRRDALLLDTPDRELLMIQLARTFEEEPGYNEAWAAEIEHRLKELDEGRADLMDWEEAKPTIFGDAEDREAKAG